MATTARFVTAVDNTRPYKSHRYDLYGPKIQRMLTLFNRAQVNTWLLLESDPLVLYRTANGQSLSPIRSRNG